MKKFRFPLATVHELRETRRDQAERDLASAARDVSNALAVVDQTERSRVAATEAYSAQLLSETVDPQVAAASAEYLAWLLRRESEARAYHAALEKRVEARRRETVEAARAAEATAKLRERQQARHAAEMARMEQNSLDEMAMVRSAHASTK